MLGLGLGLNKYRKVGSVLPPSEIGTLRTWWDFTDTDTMLDIAGGSVAGGDEIGQVNDLSGNDFHLTDDGSNSGPIWNTNAKNGFAGLTYDGTARVLLNSDVGFDFTQPSTYMVIMSLASTSGVRTIVDSADASNRNAFFIESGKYAIFAGAQADTDSGQVSLDLNLNLLTYVFAHSTLESGIRRNRSSLPVNGATNSQRMVGITVGARFTKNFNFIGTIHELAIWDGILAGNDLANAEAYFADKYGL